MSPLVAVLAPLCLALGALAQTPLSTAESNSIVEFSVALFKEVASENVNQNLVVSPLSVSTLLALVQQGAEGTTQEQLTKVLAASPEQNKAGYSQLTKNLQVKAANETLEFANGAFLNKGYAVKSAFQNTLVNDFQATIETVNFADTTVAAGDINTWVSQHTHDLIKQLITPDMLSAATRMVLTNAIYYKDLWATPFEEANTKTGDFYVSADKTVSVPLMHLNGKKFKYGTLDIISAKWLALPFSGGRFSLVIMLPDDKDGITTMEQSLFPLCITKLIGLLNTTYPRKADVTLPKFKLESKLGLASSLQKIGLTQLFSSNAQLKGISDEPVYVSDVIQKATIEVDEKGATAAAATGISVRANAIEVPFIYKADHPFLAFIVDEINQSPLFASRVVDPSKS